MTSSLRRAGMASGLFLALAILSISVVLANVGVSIDQCANGAPGSPVPCTNANFQNGNINSSNSHYGEGSVVPFRQIYTGLTPGSTYSVTIRWEFLNSGAHAYDYITTYNTTELSADPCTGVAGAVCTSPSTGTIPPDPTLVAACNTVNNTPVPMIGTNQFTLFGGTITSVGPYSQLTCGSGTASQSIVVSFTATQTTEVLAWGGHIATQQDWGIGQGATAIPGSPYHMYQDSCSFGCGAQDRSLKASSVLVAPDLTTQVSAYTAVPSQNVHDTANLTGTVAAGAPSGTVTFFLCSYLGNPYTIPAGGCVTGGTNVGSVAVTTGTAGGLPIGTATSPNVQGNLPGAYCFRAVYASSNPQYASSTHFNGLTNQAGAECFTNTAPTAVTVSSMSVVESNNGMSWAMVGLGALGIVTLGGVLFVIARKR